MCSIDKAIDDSFRKLGYSSVKQEQREAIQCVLLGRDCFVTVPTGFGKSAIFHALPLCASTIYEHFSDTSGSCSPAAFVASQKQRDNTASPLLRFKLIAFQA